MTRIAIRLPLFEMLRHASGGIAADKAREAIATLDDEGNLRIWSGHGYGDPSDCYESMFGLVDERAHGDFHADYPGGVDEALSDYLYPYAVIDTDRCNTSAGSIPAQETDGDHCGLFASLDEAAAYVAQQWDEAARAKWGDGTWPVELIDDAGAARELGADHPAGNGSRWTIVPRSPATRHAD